MSNSSIGLKGSAMIEALGEKGYLFVLPDRDYTPLMVAKAKNGSSSPEILGPVTAFVKNKTIQLPQVRKDEPKWDITDSYEDKDTASLEFSTNDLITKVMKTIFNVKIAADYSGFDSIRFSYTKVTSDGIYQTEILDYLNDGVVTDNRRIKELCKKEGECFVISETLKAGEFSIHFLNKQEAATDNEINLFMKSAGIASSGEFSEVKDGSITYSGTEPQTFAFKGVGFYLKKGLFSSKHSVEFTKKSRGVSFGEDTFSETSSGSKPLSDRDRPVNDDFSNNETYEIVTNRDMNLNSYRFI